MTEKEKMQNGLLYNGNYDQQLINQRKACKDLCFAFNATKPSHTKRQQEILKKLLGKTSGSFTFTAPFYCDYGSNITIGEGFYANHNLTILDGASVTIGDYVFIAPNCCISTNGHPLDAHRRSEGLEFARPIHIGSGVWLGANVVVLPGVTIGDNAVIGAGSVVTKDIPANVVAVGSPCRVLRPITEADSTPT